MVPKAKPVAESPAPSRRGVSKELTKAVTKPVAPVVADRKLVAKTPPDRKPVGTLRAKDDVANKPKVRVSASKMPSAMREREFPPEEPVRRVKSPLSSKELKEFKALLLAKRAEIFGDASHLAENMNNRAGAGASEHSSMPIHMADLGSDNWEQELNLGLLANEQETVREIDSALRRIEDGTFGVCVATQKPIGLARLHAKPWARYCIEYARLREEGRA